ITSLRIVSFPLVRLPEATRSARGANHSPAGGGATSSLYHKLDYPATEKTTIIYYQSQSADTDDLDPTTSADWREPTNSGANNYPLLTRSSPLAALATDYSSLIISNQQLLIAY
ncbi:hypothetical protein, partial [Ensifer sp. Root142]|uniref:hypothetical protein n=1 Tax=Ensifer sp. Root142 TaxID=1736461 RepID=UPI001AEC9841